MQCIVLVLTSALAVVAAGGSVNYCGSRMCGNTNAHTFCQFPEGPSPHCVGYISARLTVEEKSRVIARLNRRRNEAASGRMRGMPSAGNMLKLRWVEELAREAQRWADQCIPPRTPEEHDACRDLYSISVGQCVASVVGEAPGLRVESMVDIWYMQSMLYKGNITFFMPSSGNGSYYGDFAQIIWAKSYMVGCGRSRFMTPWQGRLRSVERLVCNIAPLGPPPSRPLWAPAAPAASCPQRSIRDNGMPALCDFQRDSNDIISIDSSTTLEEHLLLNTVLEIETNATMNCLGSLDEIYLTRLAIATMENTITTEIYYNSMQRRDVVEVIEMVDEAENISTHAMYADTKPGLTLISELTTILLPNIETTTTSTLMKTTKKKISLVGRPKSYNVEELTDFDEKTENNTPNEDIENKENELYPEYEFVETADENTTNMDFSNTTEVTYIASGVYKAVYGMNFESVFINETNNVTALSNQDVTKEVVTRLFQNSSMLYGGPVNTMNAFDGLNSDMLNLSESDLGNMNSTPDFGNVSFIMKDNIDDYLTDPETVRQLQEALDRIEHDMSPQPEEKQGKVRRELRDFPQAESTTKIDKAVSDALYNAELERNKSIDRGPMYNMVLKYMPYLKQYENGFLSKSDDDASKAECIVPSISVLVLTVCL